MISGYICDLHKGLLWQGSLTGPRQLEELPHLHIHCAVEFLPVETEIYRVIWAPFEDGNWNGDRKVLEAVDEAVATIRFGLAVVVTCYAGINRSAFVAALILMELEGITGKEAIEHIRGINPKALDNWRFCAHLSK